MGREQKKLDVDSSLFGVAEVHRQRKIMKTLQ